MIRRTNFNITTILVLSCAVFIVAKSVIKRELGSSKKEDNKKRTFREGTGVLIPCNVTESPEVKVWWTKNVSRSTFHQDGIVLRFNVVSRLDGGTYLCHAQNISTDINATIVDHVFLNVEYPGEAPEFFISKTRLMENDTLTINAVVEGNPDPTYSVLNNNTGFGCLSANIVSNFSINVQVRCGDSGNYMVTGYNKLNKKNFTQSEYVTVLCAPKPNVYKYNTYTVYAALGNNTSLRMDSVGYPYPQFLWRHDGINVNDRSTQLTPHTSVLIFDKVSLEDFGNYTLTMNNEYGHSTTSYQLIAQGPPGRPTNFEVLQVFDHSVQLGWNSGYDYKLPQIVHIMRWIGNQSMEISQEYVQSTSSGFQYVQKEVSNLNSSTSYRITLVSKNIFGVSQISEEVQFVTKEEQIKSRSHSSGDMNIVIPVSVVGCLALVALIFAIVHFCRSTKKGTSKYDLEKKRIIN